MQEITNLAARLEEQLRQENEIIQNLTEKQLSIMRQELRSTLLHELNIIKKDIQHQSERLGWITFRSRIFWPTIIGLSLSIGLLCGSWATMRYLTQNIQALESTLITLEQNRDELIKEGAKINFSHCDNRLCAEINTKAPTYGEKGQYRILKGY